MRVTSYPKSDSGSFEFTKKNKALAEKIVARYPKGREASAVLALLDLAQRQSDNWLPPEAIEYVADYLEMAPIRVYEVASFYTMFHLQPVGKYLLQVCRTTPCWLRGSDEVTDTIRKRCGIEVGETSEDGLFTLVEVECLGACANAPMVQINDDYFEDLDGERMAALIDDLRAGKKVTPGSQTGRLASAPEGGPQTLVALEGGAAKGKESASKKAPEKKGQS